MKVRSRVQTFIASAALLMAVAPVVNLARAPAAGDVATSPWKLKTLYNLDVALPWLSRPLYASGISINPGHTLIGRNGWLYLGDEHQRSISAKREGISAAVLPQITALAQSTRAWREHLAAMGVRDFSVVLWPDKESVYPEHLPRWALPAASTPADALARQLDAQLFVDTRAAVRAARLRYPEALYFKTDSHWNLLGAYAAFQGLAQHGQRRGWPLVWPAADALHGQGITANRGGDLANLLRLREWLQEDDAVVRFDNDRPIVTTALDFATGQAQDIGASPFLDTPLKPLQLHSQNALNATRVLWVRDSFGTAVSPFMALTFAHTLQVHHRSVDAALLSKLARDFKPDYVFVSVAERDVLAVLKALGPPP